ncbi:hypothetical protein [Metabacillus sp. FJAT-52054]|uniref:Uncharacterized protein n=1 Tax=Metabacillus sediminis TaxID=3117746 RepID=A0ABZ2NPA1_9BACI
MKKAMIINNSEDVRDRETVKEPVLIVLGEQKELDWGVRIIAESMSELKAMEKTKVFYTDSIKLGSTEWRDGILLYGTTSDNIEYPEYVNKEKARPAATGRAHK